MLQNYIKIAIRNLLRNRLFSAINIIGLAIGLASFILIILFVRDEFSWDGHWANAEDIYRVESTYKYPVREDRPIPATPDPAKNLLLDTYSEIEAATRFIGGSIVVRYNDQLLQQPALIAESNIARFFDFTFLEGSAELALSDPKGVILSKRTADRIFSDENPAEARYLGRTLVLDLGPDQENFYVSGIIANPKENSHLQHDFIVPFQREYFEGNRWFSENWDFAYWSTYVHFKSGSNIDLVRSDLPATLDRSMPKNLDGMEASSETTLVLRLVPLANIHRIEVYGAENPPTLYGLATVAFLILIIAVVNFLNLSMARTVHRAREVAMRKVLGAGRSHIVQQFLGESILLALISLVFALVIVDISLPYYNEFLSAMVDLDLAGKPLLLLTILGLGLAVGLCSGSVQALYFSVLKPKDVLYSSTAPDNSTSKLRMALVVGQFTISVALMIIAFFVNKQVEYAQSIDLGFDANNLIIVAGTNNSRSNEFKLAVLESPHILAVGRSSDVPTEGSEDRLKMRPVNGGEKVTLDGLPIGPDFFKAYNIELVAGRFLTTTEADVTRARNGDGEYRTDTNIVINASGAKLLGFDTPIDAVGQIIATDLSSTRQLNTTIVGVVANFHFDSARSVIRPGIYYVDERRQSDMSIRFTPGMRSEAVTHIEQVWQRVFPNVILNYRTMEEMVERQYMSDSQLGGLLSLFTLLAITISCLGLYGLASFTVERRTKEIGIRKVLGADLKDIIGLLLWQFSKPILIANLIAWPAAFYFLDDWLSAFVYRIDIDVMPFLLLGGAALVIGWVTVAGHAYMVARTKPIAALRYE